jgi:L-fuconolactonase
MPDTEQPLVIDTHLHFWDLATYQAHSDWMKDSPVLYRSFLPEDIKPHFAACGVDRGVIIEAARDSHALNLWWLALAERYPYIGAVVAGCFLEQADLADRFDEYAHSPYFVGIRTQPAGPAEHWADNPDTARGLNELARRDLSLDLLVNYDGFEAVGRIAAKHPSLRIILDHCGGPPLREGQMDQWRKHFAPLATLPNLHVKYSSLLLYAEPDISIERVRPVAEFLMATFGPQRLLWGSNWPVELLGGTYEQSFNTMHAALQPLTTAAEREAIYGGNAAQFYRVR